MWFAVHVAAAVLFQINTAAAADRPLDVERATQAYVVAENWIARGDVPDSTVSIEASDVAGVRVTLRFEGVTLGQATATLDQPLQLLADRRDRDFMLLVRQAAAAAVEQARQTLVALAAKPGGRNIPQRYSEVAPLVQLDMQFARPPQRIRLAGLDELPRHWTIGVQGLALRQGEAWAYSYPGTAIAANLSLPDQLQRLLRALGLDITAMPKIGKDGGPAVYRFDVMHLVRTRRDGPVVRLWRGQTVLPAGPLTERSIHVAAKLWADHLVVMQQEDGGFSGTYQPTADRFEPRRASIPDAMLACYALARFSRSPRLSEVDARRYAEVARRGVVAAVDELRVRRLAEEARQGEPQDRGPDAGLPPVRCPEAAMTLLALLETPDTADLKDARDRLAGALLACSQESGRFRLLPHTRASEATPPVQALATLAVVRMYDRTRQPVYLNQARRAIDAMWTGTDAARLASVMPWAAYAEIEMLRLGQATPGLMVVRDEMKAIWKTQVRPEDALGDAPASPDAVGGFRLDTQIVPEPTWLSAGPLAALAAATSVDGFVPQADRAAWLVDSAVGLRFLYQLTMTTDAAWYVHDLTRSLGGVRTAFWDNRQPISATAMALLAAAEMEQALAAPAP